MLIAWSREIGTGGGVTPKRGADALANGITVVRADFVTAAEAVSMYGFLGNLEDSRPIS